MLRTCLAGSAILSLFILGGGRTEAQTRAPETGSPGSPARLVVHADRPGHKVSPLLYGVFFEEINRAGDGGLYAEMVQNRSFEDADKPVAWKLSRNPDADAAMTIDSGRPLNEKNPHSLKLQVHKTDGEPVGVTNEGFKGIAVRKGAEYRLSLYARCGEGADGVLAARLHSADGRRAYAEGRIEGIGNDWRMFSVALTPTDSDPDARLSLTTSRAGTFWLDMVSLFPKDTFKGRPNGLRADLAQMVADLKPAFVRFPGGCFVEGNKIANAFRWKDTIGDIARRPGHWNLWGYRSTDGLGYHEYLQMSEDVGAEPLFVINCGMAHEDLVPLDQMGPWVQDALDAIEYANGPADSEWGRKRAENGHPAPFNLKLMEIGNENGGPAYNERYALFHDAIKAKYPEVRLIANLWNGRPTSRPLDILDEHYYNNPQFFCRRAGMYDGYDRKGPAIYVGEYAVTQQCGKGNLAAAIGEAAFMTGMERNSDVVIMASYAPLFVHVGWRQWNPDAINFDAARAYGTPSYHVQQMFGTNRADVVLPVEVQSPGIEITPMSGRIGLGTWDTQAEYKDVRVTQGEKTLFASDFSKDAGVWRLIRGQWKVQDGALRQTSNAREARACVGDMKWADYTLALKARKIGGSEGFLIIFRSRDDHTKMWWNLGGWGNSAHAVETPEGIVEPRVPGRIETGRWYDIRVELKGPSIRCYLDDKLIHDIAPSAQMPSIYAVAGKSVSGKDVILKVVNVAGYPQETDVDLQGTDAPTGTVTAIVLTSESPDDENSLDTPMRITPVTSEVKASSGYFRHVFPAHSVTILRMPAEG